MRASFGGSSLARLAMTALLVCAVPGQKAIADDAGAFRQDLSRVSTELSNDPAYRRVPLEGPDDQQWFTDLAYSLWTKQITSAEFVSKGVERFPDYQDSFATIAKKLAR